MNWLVISKNVNNATDVILFAWNSRLIIKNKSLKNLQNSNITKMKDKTKKYKLFSQINNQII